MTAETGAARRLRRQPGRVWVSRWWRSRCGGSHGQSAAAGEARRPRCRGVRLSVTGLACSARRCSMSSACAALGFRWRVLRHQHLTVLGRPAVRRNVARASSAFGRSLTGSRPVWRWLRVRPLGVGTGTTRCQLRRRSCLIWRGGSPSFISACLVWCPSERWHRQPLSTPYDRPARPASSVTSRCVHIAIGLLLRRKSRRASARIADRGSRSGKRARCPVARSAYRLASG
jgi:hypothetical protein